MNAHNIKNFFLKLKYHLKGHGMSLTELLAIYILKRIFLDQPI